MPPTKQELGEALKACIRNNEQPGLSSELLYALSLLNSAEIQKLVEFLTVKPHPDRVRDAEQDRDVWMRVAKRRWAEIRGLREELENAKIRIEELEAAIRAE